MSVFTGQVDVSDTPVQIFDDENGQYIAHEITIVNRGDSEVFIIDVADDASSVGTTGFGLLPGAGIAQEFQRPTDLRAACATGESSRLHFITEKEG